MKNKKGFVFGFIGIIYLVLALFLVGLLIWFGFRISDGLKALADFLKEWWWAIGLFVFGILWHKHIKAVVNWIFSKVGIKI